MPIIPFAPFSRLLKDAGAQRISKVASEALLVAMELSALKVAVKATQISSERDQPVTQKEIFLAAGMTVPINTPPIPLAPVKHLMRRAGSKEISEDAVKALATVIEKQTRENVDKALEFSAKADRKTIKAQDIFFALEL